MSVSSWDDFLKDGDELFNYMVHNFETMFDGDEIIKHFHIDSVFFGYESNAREIYKQYGQNIQKELIPWIKNELKNGRLIDNTCWKPFRDGSVYTEMYLGYRRLFKYKNYYFQVALNYGCGICQYDINNNNEFYIHFLLELYGWYNDNSEYMQPINRYKPLSDNTIPESFWKRM
jgi:hypothetical protein